MKRKELFDGKEIAITAENDEEIQIIKDVVTVGVDWLALDLKKGVIVIDMQKWAAR